MGKPFTRIYPRQLVSLPESDGDSGAVLVLFYYLPDVFKREEGSEQISTV